MNWSNATLAVFAASLGCSAEIPAPAASDQRGEFELVIAPWEIDSNAAYACYAIAVTDAEGGVVWEDDSICTDTFSLGPHGTLGYVGICEAGPTGQSTNTVRISLTRLVTDDGSELGHWGDAPPTFEDEFVCDVNADTVVRAAFVVLTEGTKGFLDVSVEVDLIECNAKIDCRDDFLSSDPLTGHEGTLVVALACNVDNLCMDDLRLVCLDELDQEVVVTVDPSAGPGVHDGYPNAFVFGAMSSQGVSNDGTSFWTVSIGISSGWHDCHITARMTASYDGDFGDNSSYPVILGDAVPFGFDVDGTFACVNPLNGVGSGLVTDWDEQFGCTNCLAPDESTPDDATDVIVEDCSEGPPDPQDECPPGQVDPDLDGVCECPEGQEDPDGDGVCTPSCGTTCPCPEGEEDPDGDGVCTPIPCPEGEEDPDGDGVCTPSCGTTCPCPEGEEDPDGDGVCMPIPDDGCTQDRAYWCKHHEGASPSVLAIDWPAPEDEATRLCGLKWHTWLLPPSNTAWKRLAWQWISGRLNVANGASMPTEVADALAEAEALLTTSCAGFSLADAFFAVQLTAVLEAYNNGETGPGACE